MLWDAEGEDQLSNEEEDKLNSIDKNLREVLKWVRFSNISKLKELLGTELDNDQKKLAFENSDGVNGLKELATISGAPMDTIYHWWLKWSRLGLLTESEKRKGRMARIVSLDDVGIKVPKKSKNQGSSDSRSPQQTPGQQGEAANSDSTQVQNK